MSVSIHIVSFDIPYPPNYGGVIDVYYKIRELNRQGVKVILHCFEYSRKPAPELAELCEEVCYYPRLTGWMSALSRNPYIVESRRSESLIRRLLHDRHPILLEGLHTCFLLDDPRLRDRLKIYRESNIEHRYYFHLFRAERSLWRKGYYLAESIRLRHFQSHLRHADKMLVVSSDDAAYLRKRFLAKEIIRIPSFHPDQEVGSLPGKGEFILYQANLRVPENSKAARYILEVIHDDSMPELVIAGLDPPRTLVRLAARKPNVRLVANPDDETMLHLIRHAHINLLITFQATGLKLKLLHSLHQGRFCLVNAAMVAGTGLDSLCELASDPGTFRTSIRMLLETEFTTDHIRQRETILSEQFSNKKNCKILLDAVTLSSF